MERKFDNDKCILQQKDVSFLSHTVKEKWVATDHPQIEEIKHFSFQRNIKKVTCQSRYMLELLDVYHLITRLRKKYEFLWYKD